MRNTPMTADWITQLCEARDGWILVQDEALPHSDLYTS